MKRLEILNISIQRDDYFTNFKRNNWKHPPKSIRTALERFRLCPLKQVTISIGCACRGYGKIDDEYIDNQQAAAVFPREARDKLAGEIKAMLLDPTGKADELKRWEKARAKLDAKNDDTAEGGRIEGAEEDGVAAEGN